ncbi:PUA-like domain-containing protein [Suillus placidus]|uniref:PUA-like domain-containing protein n=1 Tax=Suillus placidus TaxID=48579 RepID=A0A9P7A7P7_9AGAM|nr:PUA-like domain-containing protein [Suillus placidus]
MSYAEEREQNIARNRALLDGLGINPLRPKCEPKENLRKKVAAKKRKSPLPESDELEEPLKKAPRIADDNNEPGGARRSSRLAGKTVDYKQEQDRGVPEPITFKRSQKLKVGQVKSKRTYDPHMYGHIPDVEVGTWWATREDCSNASVHGPWVSGIAPGPDGAYSIALSGGYDDDVDEGYAFTFTGSGGRDLRGTKTAPKNLRTAPQSSHQSFEDRNNAALQRSVDTQKPVRVIRGFKGKARSKYAPSEGYRYDGLYFVKKAWIEKGLNKGGFLVCKFAFMRMPGQEDIPVNDGGDDESDE